MRSDVYLDPVGDDTLAVEELAHGHLHLCCRDILTLPPERVASPDNLIQFRPPWYLINLIFLP